MAGHRAEGEGEVSGALVRGARGFPPLRSFSLPGPVSLSRGMKGNGTLHRSLEAALRGSGTRACSAIVRRTFSFSRGIPVSMRETHGALPAPLTSSGEDFTGRPPMG